MFPGRCSARRWGQKWCLHPPDSPPCLWSPWVSDTKDIFCWVLLKPSGEEKGEHLEGRSRGLGRLGGTSALSRARALLGAEASRADSAGALSAGASPEAGEEGPYPLQSGQLLLFLTSPLPGVSPVPCFLFLGKLGAGCGNSRGRWLVGQGRGGRRWLNLPGVTGNRTGFSSQGQAILSVCRGTGQTQSLRAQVPLLEPCQPRHLSTWAGAVMDSGAS